MNHFSKATIRKLARKGICLVGLQAIPGDDGSWVSGSTGYVLNDNGTCRILTFGEVMALTR